VSVAAGEETYLGDGLYVSHDGYQICLRANAERVYLEPQVWYALLDWITRLAAPSFPLRVDTDGE
jgi:hypothetical protein